MGVCCALLCFYKLESETSLFKKLNFSHFKRILIFGSTNCFAIAKFKWLPCLFAFSVMFFLMSLQQVDAKHLVATPTLNKNNVDGIIRIQSKPQNEKLPSVKVTHGIATKNFVQGIAPLEIVTPKSSTFYLKFIDADTKREVFTAFIKRGKRFYVEIPLGTYQMKYAAGDIWYGKEHYFGENTSYYLGDDLLKFFVEGQTVSGLRIELILQLDGNLHTRQITGCEFDENLCG